jgi:hypothetical protein
VGENRNKKEGKSINAGPDEKIIVDKAITTYK